MRRRPNFRLGSLLAGLFAVLLLPAGAFSDWLEVKKNTAVYEKPSGNSSVLRSIDISDYTGPYLLHLIESKKTKGFYHIQLKGSSETGWIAATMVRRRRDNSIHPTAYDREKLYGSWIDEDKDCQDTRAEVLIRDADDPHLTFADSRECRVTGGTWTDLYTGQVFHNAQQLDVDHMVPLKNAHESGAWAWSSKRKRAYANYLDDPRHLLAVSSRENRRKGDKGPDQYLPPLQSFHCTYMETWARIKEDWELEMTDQERETVRGILKQCGQ